MLSSKLQLACATKQQFVSNEEEQEHNEEEEKEEEQEEEQGQQQEATAPISRWDMGSWIVLALLLVSGSYDSSMLFSSSTNTWPWMILVDSHQSILWLARDLISRLFCNFVGLSTSSML
jgi:cation transport ATPase